MPDPVLHGVLHVCQPDAALRVQSAMPAAMSSGLCHEATQSGQRHEAMPSGPCHGSVGWKRFFRRVGAFVHHVYAQAGVSKATLPVVLFLAILCMGSGGTFGTGAPRFSWGAFQRFWNTSAVVGAEIETFQSVPEGYLVPYGSSATLLIVAEGEMISGVRAEFIEAPGNEPGGRLFLRAIDSALRVGTYRWPEARKEAAFRKFQIMSPDLVVYEWKTSRFTRERHPSGMWVFTLEFVPDKNPGAGY